MWSVLHEWNHVCFFAANLMKSLRLAAVLAFSISVHAAGPVLWQAPTDLATRDLTYGAGGKDGQPVAPFTFISEDMDGTNPKFDVRDANGSKWKVKLGEETKPETAAARLVWAVGYTTYDNYFLPTITVAGTPSKLKRGEKFRSADNTFLNVRLKRAPKGASKEHEWKWKENPFVGTREFNGLRALMAVINNWDLKDENNKILASADGTEIYTISDLGATFGTDHLIGDHEVAKGNLESYEKSKFIIKTTTDKVSFGTPGKPSGKYLFSPKDGVGRFGIEAIGRDIPRLDARWMGEQLGQLSPAQLRDAFRASGFSSDEVEAYAALVEKRIVALKAL